MGYEHDCEFEVVMVGHVMLENYAYVTNAVQKCKFCRLTTGQQIPGQWTVQELNEATKKVPAPTVPLPTGVDYI